MTKKEELTDPKSCLNRAANNELIFVLRAHDITMAGTIQDWINRRLNTGKNKATDPEIIEALELIAKLRK